MKLALSNSEFPYEEFVLIQFILNSFIQYMGEITLGRNGDRRLHLSGIPVFPFYSSELKKLSRIVLGRKKLLVYPTTQKWNYDSPCVSSFAYW